MNKESNKVGGLRGEIFLCVVAGGLLFLNVLDLWRYPFFDRLPSHLIGVPGYTHPVISPKKLRQFMKELPEKPTYQWLEQANEKVFLTIFHKDRTLKVYENWLLWGMGTLYPPLRRTQNTQRIIAGQQALCSEISQVLKTFTERAGLPTRFIHLTGHVMLEVCINDEWVVADPDYGVVYPVPLVMLQQPESRQLIRESLQKSGFSFVVIDAYIQLVTSNGNNFVSSIGRPISPRLFWCEFIAEWLKWIVPCSMLLLQGYNRIARKRS